MKNHFIFSYCGNKREEVEKIYNLMDLKDVETIIEPCCGTSALSFYISSKHPKKYKYVLNDLNPLLIQLYKIMSNKIKTKVHEIEINRMIDIFNKFTTNQERAVYWKNLDTINKVNDYLFFRKFCVLIRMCPLVERAKQLKKFYFSDYPIYHFLNSENITILNNSDIEIINNYKDDITSLIFLDPPYIQCNNDGYNNKDMNIYEYLYKNNINNFQCKIYLQLESIWVIKLLFQTNKILETINKTYQSSKKKTMHITITKNT